MKKIKYEIMEEKNVLEGTIWTVYGIAVYNEENHELIASVRNVSSNKEQITLFVERCNHLQLSPIHLQDAIEDFLLQDIF